MTAAASTPSAYHAARARGLARNEPALLSATCPTGAQPAPVDALALAGAACDRGDQRGCELLELLMADEENDDAEAEAAGGSAEAEAAGGGAGETGDEAEAAPAAP